MAANLIVPDQLPIWVPGHLTVRSPDQGWQGISVRGYLYKVPMSKSRPCATT